MFDRLFEWIASLHGGGKDADEVCREWHSFLIGFCETLCLTIPSRFGPTKVSENEMAEEYHYYQVGRGVGFAVIIVIVVSCTRSLM